MIYLADLTPGRPLSNRDQSEADVNRWLFWSAYHFTPAVGVLNWENMIKASSSSVPRRQRGQAR